MMNPGVKRSGILFSFWLCVLVFCCVPGVRAQGQIDDMKQDGRIAAARLIDAVVNSERGETLGEVDDLVIRRSGRVKKLTMTTGGFLGIAEKTVAFPFRGIRLAQDKVVMPVTRDQLANKASFNYYLQGLQTDYYFRTRFYQGAYRYAPPAYHFGPDEPYPADESYDYIFSPARFLATTVVGRPLLTLEGRRIGTVAELLIDLEERAVTGIVVVELAAAAGDATRVVIPYRPLGFTLHGLVHQGIEQPGDIRDFTQP